MMSDSIPDAVQNATPGDVLELSIFAVNTEDREDLTDEQMSVTATVQGVSRDSRKNLNRIEATTGSGTIYLDYHPKQFGVSERRGQAMFGRASDSDIQVLGISEGIMDDRKYILTDAEKTA